MSQNIELAVKLQKIYFEDQSGELGKFHSTESERISIKRAEEILVENEIPFETVFQVRKEETTIEMTMEQLQGFIK